MTSGGYYIWSETESKPVEVSRGEWAKWCLLNGGGKLLAVVHEFTAGRFRIGVFLSMDARDGEASFEIQLQYMKRTPDVTDDDLDRSVRRTIATVNIMEPQTTFRDFGMAMESFVWIINAFHPYTNKTNGEPFETIDSLF